MPPFQCETTVRSECHEHYCIGAFFEICLRFCLLQYVRSVCAKCVFSLDQILAILSRNCARANTPCPFAECLLIGILSLFLKYTFGPISACTYAKLVSFTIMHATRSVFIAFFRHIWTTGAFAAWAKRFLRTTTPIQRRTRLSNYLCNSCSNVLQ